MSKGFPHSYGSPPAQRSFSGRPRAHLDLAGRAVKFSLYTLNKVSTIEKRFLPCTPSILAGAFSKIRASPGAINFFNSFWLQKDFGVPEMETPIAVPNAYEEIVNERIRSANPRGFSP
ncbi:hypothetical protein JTE90_014346 [Oedothorax gibbosus]|uniref:Uncharacterized protein n=1 Tax=Oedothorax gibbosus TaxID=931172 RepID=A0AAV6TDB9_9ARAC|nr:hypothetical protein JTE90_014346 [Oedothorax gibbosus]